MLEGEVEEVINGGEKLRIDFEGGNTLTLAPPRNTTFYIDGERVPVDQLTRGTDLNFYIPEDRFQAEISGASTSAPFIVIPIAIQPTRASSSRNKTSETASLTQTVSSPQTSSPQNSSAQASTAQPGSTAQSGVAAGAMTLMLIPTAQHQAAHAAIRSGCWATLYPKEGFGGDALTLVGPVEMKSMVGPYGLDWDEKLESIKTGPNTWVTIFDNEGLRDRSAKLQPGSAVQDVDEKLGLFVEVQSMSVSCTSS
jgi:hypothetical protein